MAPLSFPTVDRYETFLAATLRDWTPGRRRILAVAMAERWFPAYRAFSKAEKWGKPTVLRQALDAAWAAASGTRLSREEARRLGKAVDAVTPHMDDFEAYEALCAAAAVRYALDSCMDEDNLGHAVQATLSGFHGVEPAWDMDDDETPALWKKAAVRTELAKQLAVLERVDALDAPGPDALDRLRAGLGDREVVGRVPKPPRTPPGPPSHANQVIFGIHRTRTESGLARPNDLSGEIGFEEWVVLEWLIRYSLRKQALTGENGRLADQVGASAVIARNRGHDAAVAAKPDWGTDLREHVEMLYANRYNPAIEVRTFDAPHAYGPSLRRLYVTAVEAGASRRDAWEQVLAWARHRPQAWERGDARRSKGARAAYEAAIAPLAGRAVTWQPTGILETPWAAEVDGARWLVRLGDFPEEPMYTLDVDGADVGDLQEWPGAWIRT